MSTGLPVFADVKFHDIPNTVAAASRELARLGAMIFNIHVSGGEVMMLEAVAAARSVEPRVTVIGVTVLTSIDNDILDSVGQRGPAPEQVVRLARLAKHSGLDGVVCSAQEIGPIRAACGPDFMLVTPGIGRQARTSQTSGACRRRGTPRRGQHHVVGRQSQRLIGAWPRRSPPS